MKSLWIIVCLLFVTACFSGGGAGSNYNTNYRTGSEALRFEFAERNIEVFEGDTLPIIIDIFNRGTYDVDDGQLFVKGFDPTYLTFSFDPTNRLNIEGKNEFDPNGELSQIVVIEDNNVRIPDNRDRFDQEIQLVACYTYGTESSIPICIDPDPTNRRISNKVCQGAPVSGGAQGHPVAVTYVEPRVNRNDIRFNIQLSNVGGGTVYDRRISHEKCAFQMEATEKDYIYINRVRLADKVLDCTPDNPVKLRRDGTTIISCACRNCISELDNAYETVLDVEAEYGYRNTDSIRVSIFSEDLG